MKPADVIVVGGGPAGSTCARALVQAGFDVIVLDRAAFPRDKTCAGWITPAVVDLLDLPLDEYARHHTCQPITGFRTSVMRGDRPSPRLRPASQVRTSFDTPVSYGIRRVEFDHFLLQRSGARVVDGTPVTALRRENSRWIVNEEFSAPMLVGAGGHQCPIARHLGARPGAEAAVVAQEIEFRLTPGQAAGCLVRPDTPELYFCDDFRGYGWCFRKGDHLNVGLGRQDSHDLPAGVREFFRKVVSSGAVPADAPRTMKGHAYLLRDLSAREIVGDGALLIGDAAGLAATMSGEGIRPAVESGLMAAATIAASAPDYGRSRLQEYARRLDQRFPRNRNPRLASAAAAMVKPVMSWLFDSEWFVRNVVIERWFLAV
jgi:geranylgeranyl reductase family protein